MFGQHRVTLFTTTIFWSELDTKKSVFDANWKTSSCHKEVFLRIIKIGGHCERY